MMNNFTHDLNVNVKSFTDMSVGISEKLDEILSRDNFNKSELANSLGISMRMLDNMMSGTYNFSIKEIAKIYNL